MGGTRGVLVPGVWRIRPLQPGRSFCEVKGDAKFLQELCAVTSAFLMLGKTLPPLISAPFRASLECLGPAAGLRGAWLRQDRGLCAPGSSMVLLRVNSRGWFLW